MSDINRLAELQIPPNLEGAVMVQIQCVKANCEVIRDAALISPRLKVEILKVMQVIDEFFTRRRF